MYGYWLLACIVLGHKPISGNDDPIGIAYIGWLANPIAILTLFTPLLTGAASIAVNILFIFEYKLSASQAGIRAISLVSFWFGWFAWIRNDPHGVLYWFFD
jgi:hypothetical protein